jgi:NAD(P)-dependent dehydrogenase (short-subunit alcohol dehydrogenase family)
MTHPTAVARPALGPVRQRQPAPESDRPVARLVDGLLELAIVPSFSRLGPAIRRRVFAWSDPTPGTLAGRTVVITGPTSGLGREATFRLAELGARIVLVGRDPDRLAALRDDLLHVHGEDRFPAVVADLSSLASVHDAVARIRTSESRIDVVIDNAGAMTATRTTTPDGLETTFATMVVGPFALIAGLLPTLRATPGSRVIAVTSGGQYAQALHLDDLQWTTEPFDGTRAYARAKRAQVSLVREWTRRLPRRAVTVVAMHPGWADTPGLEASLPGFRRWMRPLLRTPREGADTTVWLAAVSSATIRAGSLFLDRRPRPFDRAPWTRVSAADRRRLWDTVVDLAGIADPLPDAAKAAA